MNVEGPFYVANYCITCFTPPECAPGNVCEHHNFDRRENCPHSSCYVGKQPENDTELESMIMAMEVSCVEAVRYCGTDSQVLEKLRLRGLAKQCDALCSEPDEGPN